MVALLVQLKLTLLRNSLRRSAWRTVGLIIGGLYGLGLVGLGLAGLVALRFTGAELAADVTVLVFALVTLGWPAFSVLVFGVDETVDPARFALLPLRASQLRPGLLVAGALGVPGVATTLVALGLVATWSRSVLLVAATLVAVPLGLVTCLLLARTVTAGLAAVLASRRFRDVAAVLLAVLAAGIGLGANVVSGAAAALDATVLRGLLADAAAVAGWTPFGWAWAVPADLARGQALSAVVHLVLAAALVAGLWWAWGRFLAERLVSSPDGGGGGGPVRSGWVDRLFPTGPDGAVAARALRYWRRDPRYLAGIAGMVIAPVVMLVALGTGPARDSALLVFVPCVLGALAGTSLAQDLSYDGSALWTHVTSGVGGREDRWGRVRAELVVLVPLLVALHVVVSVLSGRWDLLPVAVGVNVALLLGGLGVAAWVGTLWQWPAPPPGSNPFGKGSSGGLPALLSFGVCTTITSVVALPTVAVAVASVWWAWLGPVALLVGLVTGVAALVAGVRIGGRRLDAHWPEVLGAVSEKAA